MASISVLPLLLLFLLPVHANAQQNQSNLIVLGSSLSPNANRTFWLSPSGLFAFGFYPQDDGFAIGIWLVNQTEKTIIWTANRDDPPVSSNATLNLTIDGKLLLRTEQGRELSIIDVNQDDRPATSAAMLDSGNFVLYRNDSYVIWDSFDFPTDTILGGQNLCGGKHLVSSMSISDHSSGHYSLNMQKDGNLVAYPVNSSNNPMDAYWASATDYPYWTTLERDCFTLSRLGVLIVQLNKSRQHILANSSYPDKNGTTIYRATLDADGIFRLYLHHFKSDNSSSMLMEWSALSDQCDVKGFCGLNSYCSGMGSKADCNCYPGFDFINTSNKFLGCYHNFSEDDCRRSKDPAMLYNVTSLENIVLWGNYPYSVKPMKKENCGQFCLEDCNCAAVSYTDFNCRKYKLPLRYGRLNANKSTTTFFKLKGTHSTQIPELFIGNKRSLILILSLILGTVSCLCLVLATSSFFVYRQKLDRYRKLSENVNLGLAEEFTLRLFSYNELESATDGFKEELGRGSYGVVYKGIISSGGKTIAVKRLEKAVEEGEREFKAEITVIARTHHKNLVRVLGFCIEGSRKLLVYEYMNNGSLADLIFKAEKPPIWKERIRIALDVARGLLYLHEEGAVCIIHCNIKPQNILMDDNWTAKISDFGFAKLLIPNQSRATTVAEGRSAYLAPEWEKNSMNISVKADIYSFGVVLLEIVCCRRSITVNVSTADEIILTDWAYNCFAAGELEKLVEDENVDYRKLERTVKVGLWCVQEDPALRPSIKNIILMLEGKIDIPIPPSPVLCIAVS